MTAPDTKLAFSFTLQTEVQFGAGCRAQLAPLLGRQGWRRVGIIVDHGLSEVPVARQLIENASAVADVSLGWCRMSEPTYEALDDIRKTFDGGDFDAIVGIGGGSALDAAKAMAVLVHNREPALMYRGFDRFGNRVLPVVAVPTTAGTGSEVTPNASFIDAIAKRKMGINGAAIRPRFALLDPELTLSCPRSATLSAGLDSLVHATEAYVARKTTLLARMFAREGFKRVFKALPAVLADGSDLSARTEVMYGAFIAGIALMNSGTGPSAAMSYPIGVHHHVPHGLGGAMFLPLVAQHNVCQGCFDYAGLYNEIAPEIAAAPKDGAQHFVDSLQTAWRTFGVPSLRDYGVTQSHVEALVADTLELQGALDQNPVPFGAAEIDATFRTLISQS